MLLLDKRSQQKGSAPACILRDVLRVPGIAVFALLAAASSLLAGEMQVKKSTNSRSVWVQPEKEARDFWPALRKAQSKLEVLREKLEEWGTITVSHPLIIKELGQFDLGTEFPTTGQYIEWARVGAQGAATQSSSSAFSNSLALSVSPNFSVDAGARVPRASGGGLNSDGLTPPAFNANVTSVAGKPDAGSPFSPIGGLLNIPGTTRSALKPEQGTTGFTLSGQTAALLGTNAKISELLSRKMADPPKSALANPDQTIHFAIVQVSCNPGWRTRENYIGDVSATCEFYDSHQRRVAPREYQIQPYVFNVLPLLDAQTLELSNSQRQLTQLAAEIAGAYPTAAANFRAKDLISLVKTFQSDVATKTPRTITNSYSTGATFGFRFMPSLVALKDPAQRRSPAANILNATVVPALVTVVVDRQRLHQLSDWSREAGGQAVYDSVLVHLTHRWLLNDRPPLKNVFRRIGLPMQRQRVDDQLGAAWAFEQAHRAVDDALTSLRLDADRSRDEGVLVSGELQPIAAALHREYLELRSKTIGSSRPVWAFPFPGSSAIAPPLRPVISEAQPAEIPSKGTIVVALHGHHFGDDKSKITVQLAGQTATGADILHASDEQIVARITDYDASIYPEYVPLLVNVANRGFDARPRGIRVRLSAEERKALGVAQHGVPTLPSDKTQPATARATAVHPTARVAEEPASGLQEPASLFPTEPLPELPVPSRALTSRHRER